MIGYLPRCDFAFDRYMHKGVTGFVDVNLTGGLALGLMFYRYCFGESIDYAAYLKALGSGLSSSLRPFYFLEVAKRVFLFGIGLILSV